ncbi:MAG: hypothetical protein A2358_00085 [Candidatus Staskawiczbacteria bacterium RIFOXYB1_FULL_37_44]|uniref:phosphoribosylaminoimidazolesuccinocarboxamide synthase n=1 Tax=Candidatus Staskawiczbacteria bacterium RIFOXYB1_FULL_37_44 TaxID=1802223 RepID=A0A1G2IXB7_9BACT|nr:MAG: hypothetical protein A2358_00085 [Candidatus Staskawiczbacteria bacterium RIFOXYB1_FULL_37_44]
MLSVATNGISIFDFVLNALVPLKGVILNAMNHFWCQHLEGFGIKTHLLAAGADIDAHLPDALRGNVDLQSRAIVIRRMQMAPVEFIVRAVLTGSAVKSYRETGKVCGHIIPPGLQDGDAFPYLLDTPTTKAEEGHDENMDFMQVRQRYPQQTLQALQVFQICSAYAESRGIKIADTKFEFGADGTIGDEIMTPDSSRFWEYQTWLEGRKPTADRKAPPPYDKQLVRAWGITKGINKLNPENLGDVLRVHSLDLPEGLIRQTTQTYRYIFWRLTGTTIEVYLRENMDVQATFRPVPRIAIICGSESDLPVVRKVLDQFFPNVAHVSIHVMSCHRNPEELRDYARSDIRGTDAVICCGSKWLELPGDLDAQLHAAGNDIPVIGVALGAQGSRSLLAAQLAIEELPGTPVVINESSGRCYTGENGLYDAIRRVAFGELPPPKPRVNKPVQMNVFQNF